MRFDFNEMEKKVLEDFSGLINEIPEDISILKNKSKCIEILNKLFESSYFKLQESSNKDINYGSLLFKMRAMLCKKNFLLYFLSEMGIRLIQEIIFELNINNISNFIKNIISQKKIISFAYIEDNVNIHIENINTKGILKDNCYVLSGEKRCVPFIGISDFIVVMAKIERELYFFVLNKEDVKIINNYLSYDIDGFNLSQIEINNVIVSRDCIIGPIDDRYFYLINRILISGAIGLMEISFNEAITFAKKHKNMGRPIIAYQEVGFKLAEMKTLLDASYLIAAKSITYKSNSKEGKELNLIAKIFCLKSLEYIASSSLSILSSHGFFDSYLSKNIFLLSKFFQINGTSTEVSRIYLGDMALGYNK